MNETITLAHGAGGKQTNEIIGNIFKKYFENPDLTDDDAAILKRPSSDISVSTDGFIVSPWDFPGGNIGKLAVCGTVNDVACMGAVPKYLTAGFVVEEGFKVADLEEIVKSMGKTANAAGVHIVAGDTKVAGKGQVDGVFINTTGIGEMIEGVKTGGALARPGDSIIVSGDIGRHGCAILLARNEFDISAEVKSDCAPLNKNIKEVLDICRDVHVIRDATRGGVGTVLHEIASQSDVGIMIDESKIPVDEAVKGVCGLLGLEPLYLACEGRVVFVVPAEKEKDILDTLKKCECSENAAVIGKITDENKGKVVMRTSIGSETLLPEAGGELLPRIC